VISFPLVFSTGQGAEFGQRMGIVMFGGIVFSAILTFFVVPAAFFAFEKNRKSATFNAAKAEIDAACEDIEGGASPEGCEPEEESEPPAAAVSAISAESVAAQVGLADAPGRSRRKRKLPEPPDEGEEYGV
jgi:predicted RND superfamily exporter protein